MWSAVLPAEIDTFKWLSNINFGKVAPFAIPIDCDSQYKESLLGKRVYYLSFFLFYKICR